MRQVRARLGLPKALVFVFLFELAFLVLLIALFPLLFALFLSQVLLSFVDLVDDLSQEGDVLSVLVQAIVVVHAEDGLVQVLIGVLFASLESAVCVGVRYSLLLQECLEFLIVFITWSF